MEAKDYSMFTLSVDYNGDHIIVTKTLAGIYKLAKWLIAIEDENPDMHSSFHSVINTVLEPTPIEKMVVCLVLLNPCFLGISNDTYEMNALVDKLYVRYKSPDLRIPYVPSYENFNLKLNDYVICKVERYNKRHINDTFELNGYRLPNSWKKYVKHCECGNLYIDQDLIPSYINLTGVMGIVGCGDDCNDCVGNRDGYRQCEDCGRWTDDFIYIDNSDKFVCQDCFDKGSYYQCDDCGCYYDADNSNYVDTDDGHHYCCPDCAENAGYHWSESRDAWIDYDDCDDSSLIGDYHSTYFQKIGEMLNPNHSWKGSGTEIEIMFGDDGFDEDFFQNIYDTYLGGGKYGSIEHDGSVDLEIILQPMTEEKYKEFDLEGLMNALSKHGCRSHDSDECGQHTHYSANYLGTTIEEQIRNAKKVCAFFQRNWEELVKISRRKESQLSWCNNWGFKIDKNTSNYRLTDDRYKAVNLRNLGGGHTGGTIEIRLPRGTLNPKTSRATVDFFRNIVRNAKHITWKNIDNLSMWFKGITNKDTLDYIHERNAFAGAI